MPAARRGIRIGPAGSRRRRVQARCAFDGVPLEISVNVMDGPLDLARGAQDVLVEARRQRRTVQVRDPGLVALGLAPGAQARATPRAKLQPELGRSLSPPGRVVSRLHLEKAYIVRGDPSRPGRTRRTGVFLRDPGGR